MESTFPIGFAKAFLKDTKVTYYKYISITLINKSVNPFTHCHWEPKSQLYYRTTFTYRFVCRESSDIDCLMWRNFHCCLQSDVFPKFLWKNTSSIKHSLLPAQQPGKGSWRHFAWLILLPHLSSFLAWGLFCLTVIGLGKPLSRYNFHPTLHDFVLPPKDDKNYARSLLRRWNVVA